MWNGLEVLETIKYLRNEKVDPRLDQVTVLLVENYFSWGLVASAKDGRLESEKLGRWVRGRKFCKNDSSSGRAG